LKKTFTHVVAECIGNRSELFGVEYSKEIEEVDVSDVNWSCSEQKHAVGVLGEHSAHPMRVRFGISQMVSLIDNQKVKLGRSRAPLIEKLATAQRLDRADCAELRTFSILFEISQERSDTVRIEN
jgi:hypothetical protein